MFEATLLSRSATPGTVALAGFLDRRKRAAHSLTVNYAGNGDVLSAIDSANGSWTHGYDGFNRLISASKTGVSYTWDYDRFGNRWHQTQVGVGGQALTFNGANQITNLGFVYDAAGNLLMDNVNCYTYDAENRLLSTVPMTLGGACAAPGSGQAGALEGMSYVYDPDGRRVVRLHSGAIVEQDYYDAAGHLITTTDGNGNTLLAEIYAGSRHLATWNNSGGGTTYFNHADWLGTERARTNSSGAVCETITSLPFGGGLAEQPQNGGCGDPSPNHFTGKERDSESGLDNFGARYFGSNLGRFQSPDAFYKDSHVGDPQSWNEYAYARNNPLRYVDPNGEKADVSTNCTTDNQNHTTCNVNVSASIAIYSANGANLSQDQLNAAAAQIKNSIQDAWSGSFAQDGVTYNVST